MGVFYHLRYPLFALDKVIKKVKGSMIFQTMVRGSVTSPELRGLSFLEHGDIQGPGFPLHVFY
jgi:hypothetical protein